MASLKIPFALSVCFSVSLLSIFLLSFIAVKINLVDAPDARKLHDGNVPLVGGLSIFLGVASALLFFPVFGQQITALMVAAVLILVIGLLDDHYDIKVRYRLFTQFMAAVVITIGGGMMIETLGVFGSEGSFQLGIFSLPFTIFCIMVAINAFNFLDGIDGLTGLLFLIAMFAIIMCAPLNAGNARTLILPLIFIAAVVPYMAFNLGLLGKRNRVFLGDAGSMLLGLVAVWLLIRYTQGEGKMFSPVTALWIIAIPLLDMLSIVTRRSRNGKAPFEPDRNHLHHLFMDRGMSDRKALIVIGSLAVVFAAIGVISEAYGFSQLIMLGLFLALFIGYYRLMAHYENHKPCRTQQIY
jgi:UDP-GlcNAc:undecaprenyl-phosphate GlcNAc-1-phosphate transferase